VTKRQKYVDDLQLGISDEDDAIERGIEANSGIIMQSQVRVVFSCDSLDDYVRLHYKIKLDRFCCVRQILYSVFMWHGR